jgi:hypothetical protein
VAGSLAPWRPKTGIAPKFSDAELLTLAVMSALLGYPSERRWLRRVFAAHQHDPDPGPGHLAGARYCASHSRNFWGLQLHLVCTPGGLPGSCAGSSPSQGRSRTTTRPDSQSNDHLTLTITDRNDTLDSSNWTTNKPQATDLGFHSGAGDENRTRALSLGSGGAWMAA